MEGWDTRESRNGERAKSAPSKSGQPLSKLGLSWECSLQGHLWRLQSALKGEVSCGPSGSRVLESPLSPSCAPLAQSGLPATSPSLLRLLEQQAEQLRCETSPHPTPATLPVAVWFGAAERRLHHSQFEYTSDPNVTSAGPAKSFLRCWAEGMAAWHAVGRSLQLQYMGVCRALCGGLRLLCCWWGEGPWGFGLELT